MTTSHPPTSPVRFGRRGSWGVKTYTILVTAAALCGLALSLLVPQEPEPEQVAVRCTVGQRLAGCTTFDLSGHPICVCPKKNPAA